MIRGSGLPAFRVVGSMAVLFYPLVILMGQFHGAVLYSVSLVMGFAALAMAKIPIEQKPIRSAAVTAFGVIYLGGLLGFGIPIREGWIMFEPEGVSTTDRATWTMFFLLPVVVTWVADTAAYFGGRRYGKQKLAPQVSPKKTVVGVIFGLIAAVIAAVVYSRLLLSEVWVFGWLTTVAFGLTVGVFAILGDLVESALKRECGVKNSSNLLPGHGGMLDRLDSVLWALPAAFFFMVLLK